jgi:hypothetical protein
MKESPLYGVALSINVCCFLLWELALPLMLADRQSTAPGRCYGNLVVAVVGLIQSVMQ